MAHKGNPIDLNFITEDDLSDVQAAADTIPNPTVIEPIQPVEPAEPETKIPEPAAKPDDDIDLTGYSEAALLALSYQKTDKLLPDDLEIKKDLSPVELKELLKEVSTQQSEEEKEAYIKQREEEAETALRQKGWTDAHFAYMEQIMAGGDPNVVSKVAQYRAWSEAELETEEEFEAAVKAGLMIKHGNSEEAIEMIDAYVKSKLTDEEALQKEAKAQQEWIGKVADHLENQDKQRVKALKDQQEADKKQFYSDIEKQAKSGVYGLKFTKSELPKFIEYMTKETEVIDTPQGRRKVTKEEADFIRDRQDISKRIFEAYQRMTGYDKVTNKLVDVATNTNTDKFLSSIKKIEEQTPKFTPQSGGVETWEISI